MASSVVLRKSDLTSYAIELGIWETLTEGLPEETEEETIARVSPYHVGNREG